MTVQELLDKLSKYDPNAIVLSKSYVPIREFHPVRGEALRLIPNHLKEDGSDGPDNYLVIETK